MDKEMFESFANIKITDEQWRSIANDFNNTGSEDFYETLAWFFSELVENNA
jgi:hypothetical protein